MLGQDHLDGEFSAEIDIAAFEDRAHAATRDFTDELVAPRVAGQFGRRLAEQDSRNRADRHVARVKAVSRGAPIRPRARPRARPEPFERRTAAAAASTSEGVISVSSPKRSKHFGHSPDGALASRRAPQRAQFSCSAIAQLSLGTNQTGANRTIYFFRN